MTLALWCLLVVSLLPIACAGIANASPARARVAVAVRVAAVVLVIMSAFLALARELRLNFAFTRLRGAPCRAG